MDIPFSVMHLNNWVQFSPALYLIGKGSYLVDVVLVVVGAVQVVYVAEIVYVNNFLT